MGENMLFVMQNMLITLCRLELNAKGHETSHE